MPAQPVDYSSPAPAASRPAASLITARRVAWTVVALLLLLTAAYFYNTRPLVMPAGRGVTCAMNLKRIGGTLLLYANDNRGRLPPDLPTLFRSRQELTADAFVCPAAPGGRPATGDTRDAIATQLGGPPGCSYVYVGAGSTLSAPAERIIMYEPPSNHAGRWANALFADGRVELLLPDQLTAAPAISGGTAPATVPSKTSPSHLGSDR